MFNAIKKYVLAFEIILILSLMISSFVLYTNNQSLKKDLYTSINNEKAFMSENSILRDENMAFKFTIEQLNYYNDSILHRMNEVRKELRIKDNDLKQMQYLLAEAAKRDTIVFRDTLFRDHSLNMDTLVGDKWYQVRIGLKYPSTVITTPKFISEKFVIVNYRKETVNPPKKCALARLFQKKHKIVEVKVVENNPYIENKQNRFVEIIK